MRLPFPFLQLGEDLFEDLCCDILATENGIRSSVRFGMRGQRQDGIDIRAYRRESTDTELGQCKCYSEFTRSNLQHAVQEFQKAKSVWADWNVRRFVLFVASSVQNRKVQDEFELQRKDLAKEGIDFELWGDKEIARRLGDKRTIAEKYFSGETLRRLCGSTFAYGSGSHSVSGAIGGFVTLVDECTDEFQSEAETEFRDIRETARAGCFRVASQRIQKLLGSPRWILLPKGTQARMLRLAASLTLDCDHELDRAERYVIDARCLDSRENYQVIESMIAFHRNGALEALKILSEPSDIDAFNLQLALLIQVGRPGEVFKKIGKTGFKPNGETYRLASIASVLGRDYTAARENADEAFRLMPQSYLIRLQIAKVDYLHCVLESFPMWHHLDRPIPPDSEYLKHDAESLNLLRRAEREFHALLKSIEISDPERCDVETWRLACLACDPDRKADAAAYANELLTSNLTHLSVAVWAIQRGLKFDKKQFLEALEDRRRLGELSSDAAQAMVAIYFQQSKFDQVRAILDMTKSSFEKQGVAFVWRLLRAQLAAALDDYEVAEKIVNEESDEARRGDIMLAVRRITANRTNDFAPLISFLDDRYEQTKEPKYLFELCEALLRTGQPARVAERAEELLESFPTAVALQVAAQGAIEFEQYKTCLNLIQKYRSFFEEGKLPGILHRMEIECLRQLGELPLAVELAETLAAREPNTEALISLFQTQVSMGDLRAGTVTARKLAGRSEIASGDLLQVARVIHPEDQILAVHLWEEAVRRGINDSVGILAAVELGFRLGLDSRLGPLMTKCYHLSQQPDSPISVHPIDDVKCWIEQDHQNRAHVEKLYGEGAVPLHLAANKLHAPFAALLREQARLNSNEPTPLHQTPLLICAGSKKSTPPPSGKTHRMMADISSLLLADFLGILSEIENTFKPILISIWVPSFFREQIEKTLSHQPALQILREKVLKLIDKRRFLTVLVDTLMTDVDSDPTHEHWRLLLRYALREEGVLCDFAPPCDADSKPAALTAEELRHFVSCGDLAEAMQMHGIISEAECNNAKAQLGNEHLRFNRKFTFSGEIGVVILGCGMAELLAGANLLEPLLTLARVVIPEEDVARMRSEAQAWSMRLRVTDWLKRLQDRIQVGIRNGIYKMVRYHTTIKEKVRTPESAEERCLRDLLQAKAVGARFVWCDDRFLSRYGKLGGVPILGISEILSILRQKGVLSDDRFFACLLDLRKANARYIPVTGEEISYHIRRAPISGGIVRETPALIILRRYVSACYLDKERMHPPLIINGKRTLGEFEWVLGAVKATTEAIATLWQASSENDDSAKQARADWLLHNLFVSYLDIFEAQGRATLSDYGFEGRVATIDLLFSAGFCLPSPWSEGEPGQATPRQRFYAWIESRLLSIAEHIEPRLLERLAEIEARTLYNVHHKPRRGDIEDRTVRALVAKALLDIPKLIQVRLPLTLETRRWLGVKEPRAIVGIAGHDFDAAHVHKAMAAASSGRIAKCVSFDKRMTFELLPWDNTLPLDRLYIRGGNFPEKATVSDPRLPVFYGTALQKRQFLLSNAHWFDTGAERQKETIESILTESDPAKRFEQIGEARNNSAEHFYRTLFKRLQNHEAVTVEENLPPNAASLCNHLRLTDEGLSNNNVCFAACARRLIAEIGIGSTIERFATLPILLPPPIWEALRTLSPKELCALAARLKRRLTTPVSQLHLIHILADRSGIVGDFLEEAKSVTANLFAGETGRERWETFARLLEWTRCQFAVLYSYRDLDAATKLITIWLHAGRLHNLMIRVDADHNKVQQVFGNAAEFIGLDIAVIDDALWFDAAHPRNVAQMPLLLRGFGAILSALPAEVAEALRFTNVSWVELAGPSAYRFLRDTDLGGNLLGSFLGGDAVEPLKIIFTEEEISVVQPSAPRQIIEEAVEQLEKTPEETSVWCLLQMSLGDMPAPPSIRDKLDRLLSTTDFFNFIKDKTRSGQEILYFACGRVAAGVSGSTRTHLEEHVFRVINHYRASCDSDEDLRANAGIAISALLLLAMNTRDESNLFKGYHELLIKAVRCWPEVAPLISRRFGGWPIGSPSVRQCGRWELALVLRALR